MTENAEPDFPPMPVIEDLVRGGVAPELVAKVATAFAELAVERSTYAMMDEFIELATKHNALADLVMDLKARLDDDDDGDDDGDELQ